VIPESESVAVSKTMMASISKVSKTKMTSVSKTVITSISNMVDSGDSMVDNGDNRDSGTSGEGHSTVVFLSYGGEGRESSGNLVGGSAQISVATSVGNISSNGDGGGNVVDITLLPLLSGFSGGSGHNVVSQTKTISVSKVSQTKTISVSKVSESVMGYDSMVGISHGVNGVDSIGEVGTMAVKGGGHRGEEKAQEDRRLHIGLLVACNQQIAQDPTPPPYM
jgi:hypothetical protein